MKRYLTTAEAAEALRVNLDTVRRWCRQGTLPAVMLPGGRWRISVESVEEILGAGAVAGGDADASHPGDQT